MDHFVDLFGVGKDNIQKLSQEGNNLCQIDDGLFLGSVADAINKDMLKSSKVTHILTVAVALNPKFPDEFVYKVIEVMDTENTDLMQYFNECFEFIDQAKQSGGGVLVHCFMGMSRSVTIVVGYMMKTHGMSLSEAMEHVKRKRSQAAPNPGFISQLQQFEKFLQAKEDDKIEVATLSNQVEETSN